MAPVIFLFTFVYLKDEYEKEPLKYLLITFFLGAAVAWIIWRLGMAASYLPSYAEVQDQWYGFFFYFLDWIGDRSSWAGMILHTFIVIAAVEEGGKYLVLRWYNYPHKEFDEPYDGIMYGVAVSLGFAAVENLLFGYYRPNGTEILMFRMFTAVPAHAMFGVIMGYYVGKAKFGKEGKSPLVLRMQGLAGAILFHGLYDVFLINRGWQFLPVLAFLVLGLGISLSRHAMRLHADISPHKDVPNSDPPQPPIAS
ncbi:MAG: PrsW family glutamic-type intramembrane protease [Bacteroidota bacterium]